MTYRFSKVLRCFLPAAILVVAVGCFVSDATGQVAHGFRTWTSKGGTHQVQAKLVDQQEGRLTLELTDGRTVTLQLDQLSPADQDYVRGLKAASGDFPAVPYPGSPLLVIPPALDPNKQPGNQQNNPPANQPGNQPANQQVNEPVNPQVQPAAPPQPEDEDAYKAKVRELLLGFSRGRPEDRAAVAEEMVNYPTDAVISALALRGLKANETVVRLAAARTLMKLHDDPAIGASLLEAMKRQTRARDGQLVVVPGLAILLSSKSKLTVAATVRFVSTSINDSVLPQVAMMMYRMLDLELKPKKIQPIGNQQPGMAGMQQPGGGIPQQGIPGQQPRGFQPMPMGNQQPVAVPKNPEPPAADKVPSLSSLFDAESKVQIMQGLTKTRQYLNSFTFRRGVILALRTIQTRETVPALIDALERTRGEVRGDIVSYLQAVTNKQFGLNVKLWQNWWTDSSDSFTMPIIPVNGSIAKISADEAISSYYGLPLYAERMLFLLDASGSMQGGRINRAKSELGKAIMKLGPNSYFNIIVFNDGTDLWKRSLMQATPAAKQSSAYYVRDIFPMGDTETGDALRDAFKFDVEAIYLLSDGEPSDNPMKILQDVTMANKNRMISIYTIGLGMHPNSAGARFLQQLSAMNNGVYVPK